MEMQNRTPFINMRADRISSLQAAPKMFYCEEEVGASRKSVRAVTLLKFQFFLLQWDSGITIKACQV